MCHVLVIEDNLLIADHIVQILEGAGGSSFDLASTQAEAIKAARARVPDCIMSDVRLAEGTGPAAVQAIIAEHGAVPVIFMTGTPEACTPCAPPMVILAKPIHAHVLVATFRDLAPV